MSLTSAQMLDIIDRQIGEWHESAFNAEIAHRVHSRIKSDPAVLSRFVENMQQAEIAIGELRAMRAEIDTVPGRSD